MTVSEKAREALVAYITAGNVGTTNIYNLKASAEKDGPNVSCGAVNASEDPPYSGNYWVELTVSVKAASVDGSGTDAKTASDTLTSAVFDLLKVDDLAAQLSAAGTNFTVFGFGEENREQTEVADDFWVETWSRRAYCAGIVA